MVKTVSFKDKKEADIIKHLENNGYLNSFSYYVKNLIIKDMQGNKNQITEVKKEEGKRNTNFDF